MIKWFIDKSNKMPLYLQLKDLIKYYISTGSIQDSHQLPGVNKLAQELGINFETIRKAYKELEKEGLISMERGRGTFVTLHKDFIPKTTPKRDLELEPVGTFKHIMRRLLQADKNLEEVKKIIDQAFHEISLESSSQFIIFTECNALQINEISKLLKDYLNLDVKPVLIKDLKNEVQRASMEKKKLLAIVTTGFHMNEVRNIIGDIPLDIHLLITNMSPETRRQLESFDNDTRFGLICRDKESLPLYNDLLKAELSHDLKLSSCVLEERLKVNHILTSVNVLLITPAVHEEIKKKAPSDLLIFNILDKVDTISLKLLKDRIFQQLNSYKL